MLRNNPFNPRGVFMASTNGQMRASRGGLRQCLVVFGCCLFLAACNTVAPEAPKKAADFDGPTVAAPPEATQIAPPAVAAADAAFRFDQFYGVPTLNREGLSRAIATAATNRSIRLLPYNDPNPPYRVLGYLSAVGGDAGVTVSYVWDVIDAHNARVHRTSGFEIAAAANADPWSAVSNQVLQAIADRSIEDLYAWINRMPAPPQPATPPVVPAASAARGAPIVAQPPRPTLNPVVTPPTPPRLL
jgi:hypothetical protein